MQITFAVPAKTTSCFVIAVDRAPTDLSSVVPWRMADPHRREVAAALGSPRLSIAVHHPAHVIVSSTAPPSHQPRSALIARAAARAVAAEYGGVIDDPLTGNRITSDGIAGDGTADGWITGDRNVGDPGCSAESPDFDLADHWLGWNIGGAPDPACPHTDARSDRRARSADRAPLTVSTRGLRRFGMPEIMLEGDACAYGHRPFPFLLAVAERLLAEHLSWLTANPSARARTICDHLRIDCASFAPADDAPCIAPDTGLSPLPPRSPDAPRPDTAPGPPLAALRTEGAPGPPAAAPQFEGGPGVPVVPPHVAATLRSAGALRSADALRSAGALRSEDALPPAGMPRPCGASPVALDGTRGRRMSRYVLVRLSPDRDSPEAERLKVGPPVGFDGDPEDWLRPALGEQAHGRAGGRRRGPALCGLDGHGLNQWAA